MAGELSKWPQDDRASQTGHAIPRMTEIIQVDYSKHIIRTH